MQNPGDASARIELARLYEEFGDKDSAIQHLSDALHVNATDHRAWAALGRLRESRGELAQALSNYQQAYNLNQFQPGFNVGLGFTINSNTSAPKHCAPSSFLTYKVVDSEVNIPDSAFSLMARSSGVA